MAQLHGIRMGVSSTHASITRTTRGGVISGANTPPSPTDSVAITSQSLLSSSVSHEPRTSYDPNLSTRIYRTHSPYERISEGRKRRTLGGVSVMTTHINDDYNNASIASVTSALGSREGMSEERAIRQGRGQVVRVHGINTGQSTRNVNERDIGALTRARTNSTVESRSREGLSQGRGRVFDEQEVAVTGEVRDQPMLRARDRNEMQVEAPSNARTNAPTQARTTADPAANTSSDATHGNDSSSPLAETRRQENQSQARPNTSTAGGRAINSLESNVSNNQASTSRNAGTQRTRVLQRGNTTPVKKQPDKPSLSSPRNNNKTNRDLASGSKDKSGSSSSSRPGSKPESSSNSVEDRRGLPLTNNDMSSGNQTSIISSNADNYLPTNGSIPETVETPDIAMPGVRVGKLRKGKTLDGMISLGKARRAADYIAKSEGRDSGKEVKDSIGEDRQAMRSNQENGGKKNTETTKSSESSTNTDSLARRSLPLRVEPRVKLNNMDKRVTEIAQIRDFIMRAVSSQIVDDDEIQSEDSDENSLEDIISMRGKS